MSSVRPRLAQAAVLSGLKALALALLGLVLAYWTWVFIAPAPLPVAMEVSEPPGRLQAAANLFGPAPGSAQVVASSTLAVKLLGVIAGTPAGSGYALLHLDADTTHVVRAGAELAPGIRVVSVLPQQVILQRHGSRETLAWPHVESRPAVAASSSAR